jgi:hypothetical protein
LPSKKVVGAQRSAKKLQFNSTPTFCAEEICPIYTVKFAKYHLPKKASHLVLEKSLKNMLVKSILGEFKKGHIKCEERK